MVTDNIAGYDFPQFISQMDVDKYKPGVDGFTFTQKEMLTKTEAIELLEKAQEVSVLFLDGLIHGSAEEIDIEVATSKYQLNFSHETEHFGQLKYLLGTYNRTKK